MLIFVKVAAEEGMKKPQTPTILKKATDLKASTNYQNVNIMFIMN